MDSIHHHPCFVDVLLEILETKDEERNTIQLDTRIDMEVGSCISISIYGSDQSNAEQSSAAKSSFAPLPFLPPSL